MGAVCVLAPVVVAAWPALSAAVVSAAATLGFAVREHEQQTPVERPPGGRVELEIPHSEVVHEQLGRDQRLTVERDGVRITFSRDARGRASLCVVGEGLSTEELRAMGEQMSGRVVQQFIYQKLTAELARREFLVVDEQVDGNQAIHLRVRRWEK